MRRLLFFCLGVVAVTGATVQATTWTVDVHNFAFVPANLTIADGDTVHWHCSAGDHGVHHVGTPSLFNKAAAFAVWDTSVVFGSFGDSTFHYICPVHPTLMMGTITVTPPATVTVTSPNGGQNWFIGDTRTITWNSTGLPSNVTIELNRNYPGGTWETLFANIPNANQQDWIIGGDSSSFCRIRVTCVSFPQVSDISDNDFQLSLPTITMTSPLGGENWAIGSTHFITWTSQNLQHELNLDINRDYPNGPWERLYTFFFNAEQIGWIVTGPASPNCRFRVSSYFLPQVFSITPADFTISTPSITVTSPNGGENWVIGSTQNITWTSENLAGTNVVVEFNNDYPAGGWAQISGLLPNSGSFQWTVAGTAAPNCRVRIWSYETNVMDSSDADFSIQPLAAPQGLTISPQGGDAVLNWQPVPGATSYTVYRSLDPTASPFPELVGNTTATTITDLGVIAGNVKYFYQVTASVN